MGRILRKPDVEGAVGLCGRVIDNLEAAGQFPKRVTINPNGGRAVGWFSDEIDAWVEERRAAREQPTGA